MKNIKTDDVLIINGKIIKAVNDNSNSCDNCFFNDKECNCSFEEDESWNSLNCGEGEYIFVETGKTIEIKKDNDKRIFLLLINN